MENYSILMTVYKKDDPNNARTSIDSVLNQTVKTDDFVIVCDGELTDALNEMLAAYEKEHDGLFHIVRLPQNVGLGAALRHGVPLCKNELIARMDDDDIARENRCEREVQFMQEHPEVALVGSNVSEFDDDPQKPLRIKTMPIGYESIRKFSKKRNPFNHSTVMFRKKAVLDCGNYSEMRTNQDVDLWVRMLNKGYICENIDEVLVDFRFDKNTLARRKEWKNSQLLIAVWKNFRKLGYCSYWDYVCVKWIQIAMYIMPNKLLSWVYDNLR